MLYVAAAICMFAFSVLFYCSRKRAENYDVSPHGEVYSATGTDLYVDPIPKIIWSYWHSEDKPMVATQCLHNWQRYNSDFQINMLHAGNVGEFLVGIDLPSNFHQMPFQHQADWVRLALLDQHGGIWLDSSIFLTAPLDWIAAMQGQARTEYIGFEIADWKDPASSRPIVENWCMAAIKGSPFIHAWLLQFTLALKDGRAYLDNLKALGIYDETLQKIIRPEYFLMHVTAQRVLQLQKNYRIGLIKANYLAFFYHFKAKMKLKPLLWRLLFLRKPDDVPAMIKLRGRERRKLEKYLRYGVYSRRSIVGMHLMQ